MSNIVNEVVESYKGRVEVSISKRVGVDSKTPELLNGFSHDIDLLLDLDVEFKLEGRKAFTELKYNYNDSCLYALVVYHFSRPLDEEELSKVKEYTKSNFDIMTMSQKLGDKVYEINFGLEGELYLRQKGLEAPEGFVYLDTLVSEELDNKMYQVFLNNELSFARLLKLCDKLGYKVDKEMVTGIMLPVHRKHDLTGAVLVHIEVQTLFEMFKLAQNYITGFDEGTSEHSLGIVMSYDVKFNDYVLRCAKRQSEEGKDPDENNFQSEYNKAIKRINKSYPPVEDVKE